MGGAEIGALPRDHRGADHGNGGRDDEPSRDQRAEQQPARQHDVNRLRIEEQDGIGRVRQRDGRMQRREVCRKEQAAQAEQHDVDPGRRSARPAGATPDEQRPDPDDRYRPEHAVKRGCEQSDIGKSDEYRVRGRCDRAEHHGGGGGHVPPVHGRYRHAACRAWDNGRRKEVFVLRIPVMSGRSRDEWGYRRYRYVVGDSGGLGCPYSCLCKLQPIA